MSFHDEGRAVRLGWCCVVEGAQERGVRWLPCRSREGEGRGNWAGLGAPLREEGDGAPAMHTLERVGFLVAGSSTGAAAWLASRGMEGEGDTARWVPVTVQGGGVEFILKLKFKHIQIKFKCIQTLADPQRIFLGSIFLNKIWL
jgi:hypothetical protein